MEAIILAGGRGERLRPETEERPKAMVDVNGRPLLAYLLDWLRSSDVSHAIISCRPLWEVIRDHFGEGSTAFRISYAVEPEAMGRGGGVKFAMQFLTHREAPFFTLNGDTLCNANLRQMRERHQESGAMATVLLAPYVSVSGIVEVGADGFVSAFREKPELPYWVSGGSYVMEPTIFDLLPDRGDHETVTFPRLASEHRLGAFLTRGYWRPVDTMKDLLTARRELAGGMPSPGGA